SRFRLHAFSVLACSLWLVACSNVAFAQEQPSSGELIVKSWEAHGAKNVEETLRYTQQLIELYQDQADQQQASLNVLPKNRPDIEAVGALNDVATAYFIQGECYRDQGKNEDAIKVFKVVVARYCYGQAWDPRGWFWMVAKAAKESILKLSPDEPMLFPCKESAVQETKKKEVSQLQTKITLYDPGTEEIVEYDKYGEFKNIGTKEYQYLITDQAGLIAAVGE
ncbi:MAG: hypothetical protein KKC84_06095, partial [Candidatus Omnitrophica bacterium]|nr:hypothetical protein [Candidatus Omnitrophota bacterium]